ncbi:CD3337/EF1877 family mobilome membrane protein [Bacillus songklensis]|uniref:CD3337/EF1877 family mobilome membrane protein n=1 Tax=Bacillus songklensis TaxID=1069116 RepID=A0ABV8B7K6_9BACI
MKKLMRFLSLSVALLFVFQLPASAESLQDNLVPEDTEAESVGEVDLKYNEYPQHHYELDTYVDTSGDWMPWNWADGAGKQIYIALMEVVNAVWSLNVLLGNFTMKIVQEAFELDFISGVVNKIGAAIQNIAGFGPSGFMGNGLWPLLVTFVIAIVGAWATYVGMVKRESSRAWGGLISAFVIFVFSLGFFSNASTVLKGINDWSSDLQSDVLAVSASIVNPDATYTKEEGIASIRNQMFDLMVKKPYMLMQYGTTEVEESRVNNLLSIDPIIDAEERQNQAQSEVEEEKNSMMSIDGITQRAAFVPLLFIGNAIIGIFLLLVSGSIILYQMIFLVLVLFAPVPLLMALVPRWKQTAFDWAMKVVHAQLMKIAIALLLTILFGISAILYRATEDSDLGYLGMMILQIICFVGIWAKRKELFNIVSTAANNVQSSTGATLQSYRQKYNQARKVARKGKELLDSTNSRGRIRNQPLAQRNLGFLNQAQLADRQKQLQATKERLFAAAGVAATADRSNEEFKEGREAYKNQLQNRTAVDHAPVGNEKLMDRRDEEAIDQNENVTSIDELRRRRLGRGNLANTPLADRRNSEGAQHRESDTRTERSDTRDVELTDRLQSQGNHNMMDRQSHEDRSNGQQSQQLSERRGIKRNNDREVTQDMTNREYHDGNIQKATNWNETVTDTDRRVQENITTRETASQQTNRRNERKDEDKERTHSIKIDPSKPITKWEAQQQIDERNRSKKE